MAVLANGNWPIDGIDSYEFSVGQCRWFQPTDNYQPCKCSPYFWGANEKNNLWNHHTERHGVLNVREIWWCVCMRDVIGKKDHVSIASVVREIRYGFQLKVSTKSCTNICKSLLTFSVLGAPNRLLSWELESYWLIDKSFVHHNQHGRLKLTRQRALHLFKGRSGNQNAHLEVLACFPKESLKWLSINLAAFLPCSRLLPSLLSHQNRRNHHLEPHFGWKKW